MKSRVVAEPQDGVVAELARRGLELREGRCIEATVEVDPVACREASDYVVA